MLGAGVVDGRADLYAFAVILHEALTGYTGTGQQHAAAALPPPRSLNPAFPPTVEQVLVRALAKDREQRYATGAALLAALEAALDDGPD